MRAKRGRHPGKSSECSDKFYSAKEIETGLCVELAWTSFRSNPLCRVGLTGILPLVQGVERVEGVEAKRVYEEKTLVLVLVPMLWQRTGSAN